MLSRWRRWFYYPLKESVKMKVLMLNGSCNVDGSTRCGLDVMARTFAECGIESEIVNLGNRPVQDCIACGKCDEKKQCVFSNDGVNEFVQKAYDADGFVFASPVYYAHPSGRVQSFPASERLLRPAGRRLLSVHGIRSSTCFRQQAFWQFQSTC